MAIVFLSPSLAFGWGTDIPIWTGGQVNCFDVDYAMDGTMFVAFQAQGEDNLIRIYYSTDHGSTWNWRGNFVISHPGILNRIRFLYLESGKHLAFYVEGDGNLYRWVRDLNTHTIRKIKISEAPILEGSFDVTQNLNDGRIFATWTEGNDAGDKIYVKYSDDNGVTWTTSRSAIWRIGGRTRRSITFGPPDNIFNVYSTLFYGGGGTDRSFLDIVIKRSDDNGRNWSSATRLTANSYDDYDPRVAAANVDDSGVWVVYNRDRGGHEINLQFRYSLNKGQTWGIREYPISAYDGIDEYIADIKPHKDHPNQYINMVYIYDDPSASPIRKAIWAWTFTGDPTTWHGNHVVNDQDVQPWPEDVAPRIVYSPGAPGPGGGVVFSYFGRNGLYFDAPWVEPSMHTLTITVFGSGVVIITPPGVQCLNYGFSDRTTCNYEFVSGSIVELTAGYIPGFPSYFRGWQGDCLGATCVLTMDSDKEVFAHFIDAIPIP